jgi:hypothetical protein
MSCQTCGSESPELHPVLQRSRVPFECEDAFHGQRGDALRELERLKQSNQRMRELLIEILTVVGALESVVARVREEVGK